MRLAGDQPALTPANLSRKHAMSPRVLLILLLLLAPASLLAGLMLGSVDLPPPKVLEAVLGDAPGYAQDIVRQLRAPRAFNAFACGGLLAALAGLGVWHAGSRLGKCRRGRWGSPCCRCSLAQAAFGR